MILDITYGLTTVSVTSNVGITEVTTNEFVLEVTNDTVVTEVYPTTTELTLTPNIVQLEVVPTNIEINLGDVDRVYGSGTAGIVPKWSGYHTLTDSTITDYTTYIDVSGYFQCGGTQTGMSKIEQGLTVNNGAGSASIDVFRVKTSGSNDAFLVNAEDGTVEVGVNLYLNDINTGTDNTVLCLSSSNQVITDEIDSRVWGSSLIAGYGVSERIAVFSGTDEIASYSSLIYDEDTFTCSQGALLFSGVNGETPTSGAGTRMMWIPEKAAFRAGTVTTTHWDAVNIGDYSFAAGYNVRAVGEGAFAVGTTNYVTGDYAVSFGYSNTVSDDYAVSFGRQNDATGYASVCFGFSNTASGTYATCGGSGSDAEGNYSFSWGYNCHADGNNSFAAGNSTSAAGSNSFSVGYVCSSSAEYAFSHGGSCYAQGYASYAGGNNCRASGSYSRAVGFRTIARQEGYSALAGGYFTKVGDAQYQKTVLRGDAAGLGTASLNTPEAYIFEVDSTVMIHAYITMRADDGTSAYFVRRIHVDYDGTTVTMNTQTVGTDYDPDNMLDTLDIYPDGDELAIEITDDYGDDFGVVAKLEIVENGYLKPAT